MQREAKGYLVRNRWHRVWRKIVSILACIVVFCTTYALILPGITLEKKTSCGKEEHIHDEKCYTQKTTKPERMLACNGSTLGLHVHTESCYNAEGQLSCGYADFVIHEHDALCYDGQGALVCELPEIGKHIHSDACYELAMDSANGVELPVPAAADDVVMAGTSGAGDGAPGERETELAEELIVEGEDAQAVAPQVPAAGQQAQQPGITVDSVVVEETGAPRLICTETEIIPHEHQADCYDESGRLVCGMAEVRVHQHTDACFQTVEVPADTETLTCGREESADHRHSARCYGTWELTCGQEEHAHTEECMNTPEEDADTDGHTAVQKKDTDTEEYTSTATVVEHKEVSMYIGEDSWITGEDGKDHSWDMLANDVLAIAGKNDALIEVSGKSAGDVYLTHTYTTADGALMMETFHVTVLEAAEESEAAEADTKSDVEQKNEAAEAEAKSDVEQKNEVAEETEKTTEALTETETEAESETERMTETLTETETEAEGETERTTEALTETDTEAESATERTTEALTETEVETELETEIETEQTTEALTEMETESATETEKATEAFTETETQTEPGTEQTTEAITEEESEQDTEAVIETETETEIEIETETEQAAAEEETETEAETETEQVIETDPETETEQITEASSEFGTEKEQVSEEETETELATETVTVAQTGGSAETAAEDVVTEPEYLCGMQEHVHTKECWSEALELSCGLEEHTHTEDCLNMDETSDYVLSDMLSEQDEFGGWAYLAYMPMMAAEGLEVREAGIDFSKYITEVKLEHKEGTVWTEVSDGKVNKDEELRFRLNYALPGNLLSEGNRVVSYQMPENFKVLKEQSGKVYNVTDEEVGTYTISTDGRVEITFNDEFVEKNKKGDPIYGFIAVQGKVDESKAQGNKVTISFTNDLKVEVEIENPEEDKSDISVKKEATVVDEATGMVSYSITVMSESGTNSAVKLKDVMSKLDLEGTVAVNGPGINDSNRTVTPTSDGFIIDLPKMNPGDTYTLTYTAKLPQNAVVDGSAVNTVYVESTNKDNGKIEDSATVSTSFKQTYVSKTGVKDGDKIHWTVTVNAGKHDIGGWTLKDVFNNVEFSGLVTMTDSSGTVQTIALPYTFPDGSNDTYTITYETLADKPLGEAQAKNRADLTPAEGPGASSGDQPVDVDGDKWENYNPLSKRAESLTVNGDGTATVQWEVTLSAEYGELAAPWYFKDELKSGQYFTEEQFKVIETTVVAALLEKGLRCTCTPISTGGQYTGFRLDFATPLKKGESVTFAYSSTASLQGGDKELNFQNGGTINDKVWSSGSIDYKPLIRKYDQNSQGSETNHDYYDKVMDENGVLKWGILVTLPKDYNGGDLTVTEKLPEGVMLTKLTMTPEGMCNMGDISSPGAHTFSRYPDNYTVTTAIDGQTVTITIPEGMAVHESLQQIRFSVEAKIKEDFAWPTVEGKLVASFRNEATVTSKDGKNHGTSVQTQTVKKNDAKQALSKSHGNPEDNIVPYSIVVNPDGRDLLEGSDVLTLVDTVKVDTKYNAANTTLNLVPNSVHVYELNADGTKGAQIDPIKVPYTIKITEEGDEYNPFTYYVMRMTLPDKTPLVVEYKYKVNSPDTGGQKQFENIAKLEGVGTSAEESKVTTQLVITDSAAGAWTHGVVAVKVDAESYSITIEGVQFKLYKFDSESGKYEVIKDSNGQEQIYTTDSDGRIPLNTLDYNTAYYLEEVKAPKGYLKSEHPYYFCIKNSDTSTYPVKKPSNFVGQEYGGGDFIYIPNESDMTKIQVEKHWFSFDGAEITNTKVGNISFDLYQMESAVNPGSKVHLRWRGIKDGNSWFTKENDVSIGTEVKVTLTAAEDQSNQTGNIPILTVNGTDFKMKREEGTSNFSKSFIVQSDTELSVTCPDWMFANGTQSWIASEPDTPEPSPDTDTRINTQPYTISNRDHWKWTSGELPKTGTAADGLTVYYTYYVKETAVANCKTEYENNDGIVSGIIKIKNTEESTPTHELPATGGPGDKMYTVGGLLLIAAAGILLLYNQNKRRKEGSASL